jgi:hypothetical protein
MLQNSFPPLIYAIATLHRSQDFKQVGSSVGIKSCPMPTPVRLQKQLISVVSPLKMHGRVDSECDT